MKHIWSSDASVINSVVYTFPENKKTAKSGLVFATNPISPPKFLKTAESQISCSIPSQLNFPIFSIASVKFLTWTLVSNPK
jgi:hypothetical protein